VGLMDTIKQIGDALNKIFQITESSIERCLIFTFGFYLHQLATSLHEYFKELFSRLNHLISYMRTNCGLGEVKDWMHLSNSYNDPSKLPFGSETESQIQPQALNVNPVAIYNQDWSHLQAALRMLEICFSMKKKINSFENTLREKILNVKQVIFDTPNQLEKTHDVTGMQMVIIKSQLGNSSFFELRKYLQEATVENSKPISNLPLFFEDFIQTCQTFLFDSMFKMIEQQLNAIPKLDIWNPPKSGASSNNNPSGNSSGVGGNIFEMPVFSLSPSTYVTRIGEHLLLLPQQLEPYATDPYLTLANNLLPFLESSEILAAQELTEDEEIDTTELWIISVVRGTMILYYSKVLQIPHLSEQGCKQLVTDLQYFRNVLSALEMPLIKEFDDLLKYLAMTPEAVTQSQAEMSSNPLFSRVAEMRGLTSKK